MSSVALPQLTSGGVELDMSPERFGWLRVSSDILLNTEALQHRMEQDGYLYIPGFFDREEIKAARLRVCTYLSERGALDPHFPIEQAVHRPGASTDIDSKNIGAILRDVVYGDRIMEFFSRFLGGPATHFDFTWFRSIQPGIGSYPHCDVVFMGRGTKNLYTSWIPYGDIPLNVGGLIVIEGSNRDEKIRSTYCEMDVDTACKNRNDVSQTNAAGYSGFGALSHDMREIREQVGGRLLTSPEYRMGDLLLFSVYTVHGSLDNHSKEVRLSSDTRYQLASDPIDERWIGEDPPGHGKGMVRGMIC